VPLDYDLFAREYAAHRTVHPEVLLQLISTAGIGKSTRVLEVGCGTGNYIRSLVRTTGCHGIGTDPSEEMLARARTAGPDLEYRTESAETLGDGTGDAGAFDFVFSVDVIHHVENRAEAFRRMHRALAPEGLLCTVTDSEEIIRRREPLAYFFPETVDVDLARYPRIETLRTEMEAAGFVDVREEPVEFSFVTTDVSPYRERIYSCLRLITPQAFHRGMAQLEEAARDGFGCTPRYLMLWGRKPEVGG
jgi:SAM-dependent methyltransferase